MAMANPELKTFVDSLNLEYKAVFVPQSASRNSGEKNPSLNWRISIRSQRGAGTTISTDYMQGIGHVPNYIHRYGAVSLLTDEAIKAQHAAAELGTYPRVKRTPPNHWEISSTFGEQRKPLPPPDILDVLHCLVSDSDAADYTFDDWCSSYGYDTDSRKAEATYSACRDIGRQLERMLGRENLAKLRELFQDY
jgi:hypothetical protein